MPTQITSSGITFNDATSLTSANIAGSQIAANAIGATQIANGSVTASKLGTNEQRQICKAWVNFNGTGTIGANQTIRSSYNVSSVTKHGTGRYTVNFTTQMSNVDYVATSQTGDSGSGYVVIVNEVTGTGYQPLRTTSTFPLLCLGSSSTFFDSSLINYSFFSA